jgi:spore coat protein CotH
VTEAVMRVLRIRELVLLAAVVCVPVFASAAAAQEMDEFFDDSVVHDIRITINSKDWTALKQNYKENIYYPVALQWKDVIVRNVGIRSRGLGSRSASKPGLKFDMDIYSADQTFLGLKSFVLDNLVQDSSMLKERLSMAMFRRLGIPAPREAHARLYVNNTYSGMYAIVETIDKGYLGRNFGADSHGGTENDGYLYEYDWVKDYRFEYMGDNLDEYKIFDPKTNEKKAAAQIWGPVEDMIQTMNQAPDSTFVRDMTRYLDLGVFAKTIAIENFLAEDDGILGYAGLNNFYIYRFEDSDRFQFLPWDKDNTFASWEFWIFHNVNENVLARRTLNIQEYRNRFLDTLLEAAQIADEPEQTEESEDGDQGLSRAEAAGPGWLEREITRQYNQIRTLARADTFKPYSNNDFEEAYEKLLEFARNRSAYVREKVREVRPSR